MMKTIAVAAILLVAAIAVILAYAATRPDRFRVARFADIKAPPEKIFPLINDLKSFNGWNPFDKQDPDIKGAYSGPQQGKGATYAFESRQAGTGSLEILDATPPATLTMRLLMSRPIAADNRVDFTLDRQGDGTRVTWAMEGAVPFIGKVLHLIFNMDKMVGGQFERGLTDLKAIAER
jgi:hypothetical protein